MREHEERQEKTRESGQYWETIEKKVQEHNTQHDTILKARKNTLKNAKHTARG